MHLLVALFRCPSKYEASKSTDAKTRVQHQFCCPTKYEASKRAPCGLLLAKE